MSTSHSFKRRSRDGIEVGIKNMNESTTTRLLMDDMSRFPVMNHDEVIRSYIQIENAEDQCRDAIAMIKTRTDIDLQTKETLINEQQRALDAVKQATYAQITSANIRLVWTIAKQYRSLVEGMSGSITFLDLIQEGTIGLMEGVRRFDHRKGFRLATYSHWWIRRAITRHLSGADDRGSVRIVRLPAYIIALKGRINALRARENELREAGHDVTPLTIEETAEVLNVDVDAVRATMMSSGRHCSIGLSLDEQRQSAGVISQQALDSYMIEDSPFHSSIGIEDSFMLSEAINNMQHILMKLPKREEQVLRLRFGIDVDDGDPDVVIMSDDDVEDIKQRGK